MKPQRLQRNAYRFGLGLILLIGITLFSTGLLRGLRDDHVFHPDTPKQILAVDHYQHGRMLWRLGNWFYDGYPYGLNVLDAAIIRGLYAGIHGLQFHLFPEAYAPELPTRAQLFYWTRILRVVYGGILILLTAFVARHLTGHRRYALAAALLVAVSPLTAMVTHAATGDIGVDLFALLMLAALCLHLRHPRLPLLFAAAFFCGYGFACKYHGALTGLLIAPALLAAPPETGRRVVLVLRRSATATMGFLVGAVLGTPALWVDPNGAWHAMKKNFVFIQKYSVDPAFFELPLLRRIPICIGTNLQPICSTIGWSLLVVSLVGVIFIAVPSFHRKLRTIEEDNVRGPLVATLLLYPFFFLAVSLCLKPEVQPFHFSHLVPVLAIGAVITASNRKKLTRPTSLIRWIPIVLLVLCLAESLYHTWHEQFLWRRPDLLRQANAYASTSFTTAVPCTYAHNHPALIKSYELESHRLSPFRNRTIYLKHGHAPFWLQMQRTPTPTIPFPGQSHWIFMNGPVLPRNDRMFCAPPEQRLRRDLVLEEEPGAIMVGLRSDAMPCEVTMSLGKDTQVVQLRPFRQWVGTFHPHAFRKQRVSHDPDRALTTVPLSIQANTGPAWVSVLDGPSDLAYYQLFGGHPKVAGALILPGKDQDAAAFVDQARFYESRTDLSLSLHAGPELLQDAPLALPAGVYRLTLQVVGDAPTNSLHIWMDDPLKVSAPLQLDWQRDIAAGIQTVSLVFEKPFAPYRLWLHGSSISGLCRIASWQLKPETARILADVRNYRNSQTTAAWMQRIPEQPDDTATESCDIKLSRGLRLTGFTFPGELHQGAAFSFGLRARLTEFKPCNVDELAVFVHLLDEQERVAATFDFPFRELSLSDDVLPMRAAQIPDAIEAGPYQLVTGVYNTRTRLRLAIRHTGGETRPGKVRSAKLKTVRIQSRTEL